MDLRALTKVDLHRHLEGAIRLQTLLDLYREGGAPLPEKTPGELAPRAQVLEVMDSLEAVLSRFAVAQGAFFSEEAAERIAYEAVEDLARDNVRLAELRLSPEFLCEPHGLDWDGAMDAIVRGVKRASAEHDVAVGLIAIASRNYGIESAERTMDFALSRGDDFVAFDLAGDENAYPPSLYVDVIQRMQGSSLKLTTHYGESGGPQFPREAIEALGSMRLGHGISVAHDSEVTALARDRGVALEMCPTSHLRTGSVPSLDDHPSRQLLHDGVKVTINTDNPGLFAIDLTNELELARDVIGFSDSELRQVTANALEASFLDEAVKADIRERHFGWLEGAL